MVPFYMYWSGTVNELHSLEVSLGKYNRDNLVTLRVL